MPLGLSTSAARASGHPGGAAALCEPDALLDRAVRVGAAGLVLDDSLPPAYLAELVPRLVARRGELPVWAVENVCPTSRRAAAQLAALDREEAAVAVEVAEETLRLCADLGGASDEGGPILIVRLGEVSAVRDRWPPLRRAFLRDELDDTTLGARLARERDAHAPRHLDAARRSLHRLGRAAEARGVRLGLRNPGRPIGLPSPVELGVLLADLDGAPVVPVLDLPAAHLGDALGLRPLDETLKAWATSPLSLVADACGAVFGLAPGMGELDLAAALRPLPATCRLVFAPSPLLDERELLEGAAALHRLSAR